MLLILGHVQSRMGRRLRNTVAKYRGIISHLWADRSAIIMGLHILCEELYDITITPVARKNNVV